MVVGQLSFFSDVEKAERPKRGHYQKHSEETKQKMSEIRKKNPNRYWLGKSLTEKAKRKLSEAAKARGSKPPSQKGAIVSKETRLKRSISLKGRPGGFLGGKHSDDARKKIGDAFRGSNHPNWMGGITPLVARIRHCGKYVEWRKAIFHRDNYTCQICGVRGGWIEADHFPIPFSNIFHKNRIESLEQAIDCSEFWDVSNGRTLCRPCHNKNKKGWIRKGQKQLQP
jgi:hypothetical protein